MQCKECKHYVICLNDGEVCDKFEPRIVSKKSYIDPVTSILDYISRRDWRVAENANMPFSFANLLLTLSGKSIAEFWLKEVYHDLPIEEMHKCGFVHVHDLGLLTPYCFSYDTEVVTANGSSITLASLFAKGTNEVVLPHAKVRILDEDIFDHTGLTRAKVIVQYTQPKECIKIEANGSSIVVSEDHAVLIKRGDKFLLVRADEIQDGDELVFVGG